MAGFRPSGGATNALLPPLPLGEGWGEGFLETGGDLRADVINYAPTEPNQSPISTTGLPLPMLRIHNALPHPYIRLSG